MWVPFLFDSSLSGVLVLSDSFSLSLSLSLFLCSTQLCKEFLAIFGGLRSSASIQ